jgi:hypothetical protein
MQEKSLGADAAVVDGVSVSASDQLSHAETLDGLGPPRRVRGIFQPFLDPMELAAVRAGAEALRRASDYYSAAREMIRRHDADAVAANFTRCGCEDCKPFRAIVAKAGSGTPSLSEASGPNAQERSA